MRMRLAEQLDAVRSALDEGLYPKLPKAVIHGDIHPGNVKFKGSRVAAVYDFDYLSLQARIRDIVDAIIFLPPIAPNQSIRTISTCSPSRSSPMRNDHRF